MNPQNHANVTKVILLLNRSNVMCPTSELNSYKNKCTTKCHYLQMSNMLKTSH